MLSIRAGMHPKNCSGKILGKRSKENKKLNYMTVSATIKELEKIELTRQADNIYRPDHAVTKTQKNILNAFGLTDKNIECRANWISEELKKSMMKQSIN